MLNQDKEMGHKSYEPFKTLEPEIKNFFLVLQKWWPFWSTGYLSMLTVGEGTN